MAYFCESFFLLQTLLLCYGCSCYGCSCYGCSCYGCSCYGCSCYDSLGYGSSCNKCSCYYTSICYKRTRNQENRNTSTRNMSTHNTATVFGAKKKWFTNKGHARTGIRTLDLLACRHPHYHLSHGCLPAILKTGSYIFSVIAVESAASCRFSVQSPAQHGFVKNGYILHTTQDLVQSFWLEEQRLVYNLWQDDRSSKVAQSMRRVVARASRATSSKARSKVGKTFFMQNGAYRWYTRRK